MRVAHTCIRVRDPERCRASNERSGGREDVARICCVQHPDGYRVELIDRPSPTPQDSD
jgi:hypothetical protein